MGGSLKVPRWGRGSVEGTAKQMGEGSLLSGKMREGQMSGSWWICKEGGAEGQWGCDCMSVSGFR